METKHLKSNDQKGQFANEIGILRCFVFLLLVTIFAVHLKVNKIALQMK